MQVKLSVRRLLVVSVSLLWSYLTIVLLYERSVAGVPIGAARLYGLIAAGCLLSSAAVYWLDRRDWLAWSRQGNLLADELGALLAQP